MCRIVLILLLAGVSYSFAQSKPKTYKLKILTKNGQTIKGYLIDVNDSAILISSIPYLQSNRNTILYENINLIKVRDKKALGKGALIGAASGAVLGAVIGFATYTPPDCTGTYFCLDYGPEYNALGGAILGCFGGTLIGLAVGSSNKVFHINMSKPTPMVQTELQKYIIPN